MLAVLQPTIQVPAYQTKGMTGPSFIKGIKTRKNTDNLYTGRQSGRANCGAAIGKS
jgi:hypothetical protein